MKLFKKYKLLLLIICIMVFIGFNLKDSYANEPIMEYKFTVEEQKIKRAQFIWKSCIESLRNENILTTIDVKNINSYLMEEMRSGKFESPLKRYERQKNALRPTTIDNMVKENVINEEKATKLKDKMSQYNLNDLENLK